MPPRVSNVRRKDARASEDYRELGVVGRKTGIGLPNLGARDEHGMAPIDGLFSSPEKETPPHPRDDATQGAMDMDLETEAGPGPMSILKGAHRLLPRGTSPRKSHMQSPALRNPHLGRSSSPVRGSIVGSDSPNQNSSPVARKLNYGAQRSSVSRPINGIKKTGQKTAAPISEDEEEEEEPEISQPSSAYGGGGEESMQMVDGGNGDNSDVDDASQDSEPELPAPVPRTNKQAALSKPGRPKKTAPAPEPEPESESDSEPEPLPEPPSDIDDEPEPIANDAPSEPEEEEEEEDEEPSPPRKRGRPGKEVAPGPATQKRGPPGKTATEPSTSTKRPNSAAEDESEERALKRSRTEKQPAKKPGRPGRPPKATAATQDPTNSAAAAVKSKAPGAKRGRKPRASAVGDDSVIGKVQKGPPLPKARGLMSVKRQDDNILTTRSGRHSYKPLNWWRNERVVHNDEEGFWQDAIARTAKHDKFFLPSIKEVVRIDETPPPEKEKKRAGRPRTTGGERKRGRRAATHDDDEQQEPPEPWETEHGRVEGETIVWEAEYEHAPPAPDEPVQFEQNEIAIASGAIQTREIKDATFKFAKLLSMPFFGAGVVDLPPGTEKKPKNSRKNQMTFFVHQGKVLVTVNETQFRISTGGFWNVPRGNYYSIQNDYDQPARLFFSQGSEVAVADERTSQEA